MVDITAATETQFDTFLADYGYTVGGADKTRLLALSLAFLKTVDICTEGDTYEAQCFIAYAMSAEGGNFNPAAVSSVSTTGGKITHKEVQAGPVKTLTKYSADSISNSSTDPLSMLKRIPMAYGILKPLLCSDTTTGIGNFDVIR